MAISTAKMTARQFLLLGADPPGVRLELVDGEVAVSPSPTPDHQEVVLALGSMLRQHVQSNNLGRVFLEVDTILSRHEVRRPDLLYFSTARLDQVGKKFVKGPPDLCVEVVSFKSRKSDRKRKFELYRQPALHTIGLLIRQRGPLKHTDWRRGNTFGLEREAGVTRCDWRRLRGW